jgi:hypothetical protein
MASARDIATVLIRLYKVADDGYMKARENMAGKPRIAAKPRRQKAVSR